MYITVYDYKDYKKFLNDWIGLLPHKGRGQKVHLAQALRCQTPFISHVLSGDYHFSVEQTIDCARWMALDDDQTDYLVRLVLKARAGTRETENFFERQIQRKKSTETELKKRLKIKEGLSEEDQNQYYSSWHYAAVHMALLNPQLQSLAALQNYFQLPLTQLGKIIDFLARTKLVETKPNGKIKNTARKIHLERNSPLIASHHTNWRLHAIDKIKEADRENLHYSSVMSLSAEDYDWVKSKISILLEEIVVKITDSPDEKLAAFCFDWFEL
jgi:uncharacterized protein (TIGR02147 family)